jgi:nicotinate-nucleotide adenylyltransferase
LILASELRHALSLDRVLFVPVRQNPFVEKQRKRPPRASDADRLAMLELALANAPGFEIDRTDIARPPPSRSADLLAILNKRLAPVSLVFLMGEDALGDFPSWHDPSTIVRLAEVGVASRAGANLDQRALDAVFAAVPTARGRVHRIRTPQIEISGTDIRARIHDGRPIAFLVPREVERYIHERGLYQG